MLVSFSIANFRSFFQEQTFSLVASKRLGPTHQNHVVQIPNSEEFVLRTAVLYGANGAGKSSLFKALRYMRMIAIRANKRNSGTHRDSFIFDSNNQPSTFDIQFITNNKLYRYGFKCCDTKINEEWLVEIIGNRERVLFERLTHSDGTVEIEASGITPNNKKMSALATIGGPPNQSFLSTIYATLDKSDVGDELVKIITWFSKELNLIAPNQSYQPLVRRLSSDSQFLSFTSDFLKSASTGVDHLITEKIEISELELKAILPSEFLNKFLEQTPDIVEGEVVIMRLPDGDIIVMEMVDGKNKFHRTSVKAIHKSENKISQLDLKEESDGTRRLLDLIPALHFLYNNERVYFIDEIDRSMHPMLVRKLIEQFLNQCTATNSQLIFTTHESTLLDLDLFRRDEIWFVEKDRELETKIYSLVDFKVRTDLDIRKNYLNGRFGAIPFLSDFSKLLNTKDECTDNGFI